MEKNISRRSFLKGTAIGAAGIAVASTGLKLQESKAEDAIAWDAEYDVVVLGYGGAGANAAVAAYENGAKVLLAEKAPEGAEGGNTAVSGQFVMATDDADGLYDYLTTLMGYKLGRKDYWYYNWAEFPEIPSSVHCLCLTATGTRFDRGYYNLCQNAVKARPIDVWFAAPGKKLITDAEGAVIGVIINKDGADLKVKANGGVVLACGGFEHNQEMIASFLQMPYVHQQGGLYNDGDGIKMALGAGADLWHMSTRHGRIYIGGRWISTPMPLPAYLVQDSDQLAAGKKLVSAFSDGYVDELKTGEVLMGETLEELAEAIRNSEGGKDAPDFSTERFVKAVNDYNKRYDAGEDADYGRPFSTMVPVKKGPFYATKIGPTYFNTQRPTSTRRAAPARTSTARLSTLKACRSKACSKPVRWAPSSATCTTAPATWVRRWSSAASPAPTPRSAPRASSRAKTSP